MLKDPAARRGLAVFFGTLIILVLDLIYGARTAHAAELLDELSGTKVPARPAVPSTPVGKAVASLIVTECDKIVGFIVTDEKGNIIPVPLEGANMDFVNSVLNTIPEGHRIQATLPCKQGAAT